MNLEPQDVYLALSMLAACVAIYGVSKWLYYDARARAIKHEIDAMPPIDYASLRPRDPSIRLTSLPEWKARELREQTNVATDRRRLDLVMRNSTNRIH